MGRLLQRAAERAYRLARPADGPPARRLEVFENLTAAIAIAGGRHYRALRALGHTPRKTIDVLIATFCIEGGHALLHRDRDFDPFEEHLDLAVLHP